MRRSRGYVLNLWLASVLFASACATSNSENKVLLEAGLFGNDYRPPDGANQLMVGTCQVTLEKLKNGGMGTDFGIDVNVRNIGSKNTVFDPAEIEIQIPESGLSYFHVTRNANLVNTPPGINVLLKTELRPGQAIEGMLWYKTPPGKAEVKSLDVNYRTTTLHFPPAPAATHP